MSFACRRFHTHTIAPSPRATIVLASPMLGPGTDIGTTTVTVGGPLGMPLFVRATTLVRGIRMESDLVRLPGGCAKAHIVADVCPGVATFDPTDRVMM